MGFLTFLIILFVILILFVAISTIIKFVLFITTKYKYDNYSLILPSVLSFISWFMLFIFWYFTLTKILNVDIYSLFFNIFLKTSAITNNIRPLVISSIVYCLFGILLQSFTFLTVNVDYIKIFGHIRIFAKKRIITKSNEEKETSNLVIDERPDKLSFSNAFISSLFAFSSILFCLLILLAISNILSKKILL
jgi:hypothetical protein